MQSSLAETADTPSPAIVQAAPAVDEADPAALAPAAKAASLAGKRRSDAAGMALAALCAIHCVATPLIALLPMGALFTSTAAEWLLPAFAVVIALAVIGQDTRAGHRRRAPAIALGVAALLIAAGHAFDHHLAGTVIAVIGSFGLAVALVLNVRARRRAGGCRLAERPGPPPAR